MFTSPGGTTQPLGRPSSLTRSFTSMGTSRIDPGNGTARAINSIPMPALELVNRPHCLYRRPAIRQPRKAAHDRENPVRLTKVKRLNRENDPGMQCAPPPRR